jgi:RecB family exonuclease
MGTVIQAVIERFYNDEIWKDRTLQLSAHLTELTQKLFDIEINKSYIDWTQSPPREELLATCIKGVVGYLQTMKHHKLLGVYAKAEVDLTTWLDKHTKIGGRADLILRRDDTGLTILDGKNSQHKGKYQNLDQLKWYALCFYLAYKQYPDRLGYVYYRFPHGFVHEGKTETGVQWVPYEREELEGLAKRAKRTLWDMKAGQFEATPNHTACRFCEWESECPQRQDQKKMNPSWKNEPSPLDGLEGIRVFKLEDFPIK